jgi:predicted dehydrogenase
MITVPRPSRRSFLRTVGAASLAVPSLTRTLRSNPPSGILRHASFGASGMAWADIQAITSSPFVRLVAVAEVDAARLAELRAWFPETRVYSDWRVLLDREAENLDSVNVSTPDHSHAAIALRSIALGKHVYCQKPLAQTLEETRALSRAARARRVVTQMGIQIHSQKVYRQAVALLRAGAIGKVREVHTWSNKTWGDVGPPPPRADAVPAGLNWDVWLSGRADRPYLGESYYHPGNWRRRLDFGTGTLGDMGCHILDPVFEGLELHAPVSVRSEGPAPDAWNWSVNARIRYVFPGSALTAGATLPLTWYDGAERPPREVLAAIGGEPGDGNPPARFEQGSAVVGTRGILHIPHIDRPRLHPEKDFAGHVLPEARDVHHWTQWAEACRTGATPSANFDYAGPLSETVLLGCVALRFPETTLRWDSAALAFGNLDAANAFVRRSYRRGWELPDV